MNFQPWQHFKMAKKQRISRKQGQFAIRGFTWRTQEKKGDILKGKSTNVSTSYHCERLCKFQFLYDRECFTECFTLLTCQIKQKFWKISRSPLDTGTMLYVLVFPIPHQMLHFINDTLDAIMYSAIMNNTCISQGSYQPQSRVWEWVHTSFPHSHNYTHLYDIIWTTYL